MPKYDVLEKIVTSLDVNPDWLLTGRGNMEKEPDLQQAGIQVQEKFPLKTDNLVDLQRIPLYNLEATAGLVSLFNDVDAIPISYISLPDLPACDGAVYVRGDSMYPLLKSGDIVLYKQVHDMQYGIFWGEMYLISANVDGDEFVTIKYIHKSERENCVKLVSHNQHHEPKDIPISMIRALALVKASVRYNTIR
ncbi:helix-turn-helix transcriptional regulator [Alistipes shahii]|uniref:Helix-turn-helix transcriptional regulator n=6 Tax=Rikenellaceae TaxID=171550 RepID=A0A5B3G9R0_9BACT|nr:helix-turn-helix transcriptional regulator [Alistipes shahii]